MSVPAIGRRSARGTGGSRSDINVTPLIDVVLVLLIIFMIIMPMRLRVTPLEIPPPAPPDAVAPQVFVAFDDPVPWREAVAIMDTVRGLAADPDHDGVTVALATRPERPGGPD